MLKCNSDMYCNKQPIGCKAIRYDIAEWRNIMAIMLQIDREFLVQSDRAAGALCTNAAKLHTTS